MTTAEMLAIAVLKGDNDAIRPLLDCLLETLPDRERQLLPVKTFKVESNDVRVVLFVDPQLIDQQFDFEEIRRNVRLWLSGENKVLGLCGFSHVELYEFPTHEVELTDDELMEALETEANRRLELRRRMSGKPPEDDGDGHG